MLNNKSKVMYINLVFLFVLVLSIIALTYFSKNMDNFRDIILIFIILVFLIFIGVLFPYLTEIRWEILELRRDIQSSVVPKFLNTSIETNDLIELAIDVWRMEDRMNKALRTLPENQHDTFHNSIKKIKRYLDKNDIEIIDYTNQKFNDGRNLDILAIEKDSKISHSIIKETKEPTIMYKGQVVRKGKVVVLAKNNDGMEGVQNE